MGNEQIPCCRACQRFDASRLEGYGYCKSAGSVEARAKFFHSETTACWKGLSAPLKVNPPLL
jgi:hypothetical protein